VFEDGKPLAVLESGTVRPLAEYGAERTVAIERALARRAISPALRAVLGISGRTPPVPGQSTRRRSVRRSNTPTREES
jgi:hypothetical protein